MDDLGLLLLQIEWGADEALEDQPLDRMRPPPPRPAPATATPRPAAVPARPSAPTGTPGERATRDAARADTLEALKAAIVAFEGCPLRDMATQAVFAAGDPAADVMLIGGAPGAEDDRSSQPFSGPEGSLLTMALTSAGLTRERMMLTPLIPWRPPGGRPPTPAEIQLYRPFLIRLIGLVAPKRIVLFGPLPANALLGGGRRSRAIGWTEGSIDGRTARLLLLPALAEAIKLPARRKELWAGMRALRRSEDETTG
jgi:DNA polymerase